MFLQNYIAVHILLLISLIVYVYMELCLWLLISALIIASIIEHLCYLNIKLKYRHHMQYRMHFFVYVSYFLEFSTQLTHIYKIYTKT
jgi:hypothetical protein